ncbi:LamG domain-containing protein [Micromonospora sp. NPDC049559]|uniref:LamG domain-containing protein n=1 Tax=Micromonospora sp. NPDC049559 TaxID=3155923 RepID=UPI003439F622
MVGTRSTVPTTGCVTGSGRPAVDTTTPELRAVVSDADGGSLSASFEWWSVTGTAPIGSATVSGLASGATAATGVPTGALATGGNYRWRVRASDGAAASAWSSFCEFTVRTTAPPAPNIVAPLFRETAGAARPFDLSTYSGADSWLRARWPLHEGTGGSTTDTSFYGRFPLTLNGAAWNPDGAGASLTFNGTGSSAATDRSVVATDEDFTVTAWVRLPAGTTGTRTVLAQEGSRGSGFFLQYTGASNRWAFGRHAADTDTAATVAATSVATARPGVWTHLAGVYDGINRQLRLYVDGLPVATTAFTTPWNARGALVLGRGKRAGAAADWWSGGIDDVRVYEGTLGTSEISELANEVGYEYQLDDAPAPTSTTATGSARVVVTPATVGARTLTVRARNRAGQLSAPASYPFDVLSLAPPERPETATTPEIPCVTGPGRPVLDTTTPTLRARVGAGEGWLSVQFDLAPIPYRDGFHSADVSGTGPDFSYTVPPGVLADHVSYAWRATASADGEPGPSSVVCEFTVSAPEPPPPAVRSDDYPDDGWRYGGAGQPGSFGFRPGLNAAHRRLQLGFHEGAGNTAGGEDLGPGVTLSGGAGWVADPAGASLGLNGTTGYAVSEPGVLQGDEDYTVGAWVRLTGTGAAATVLSQEGTRQSLFRLGYSRTDNRWALTLPLTDADNAAVAKALATTAPQAGVWTHLAGVHDSARKELRIYVNGRLEGTAAYSARLRSGSEPFTIGRARVNGAATEYWPGQADDVVAFTRTLTEAEIAGLAGTSGYVYQFDGAQPVDVPARGLARVVLTPEYHGEHTLSVRRRDATGALGEPTTYSFLAGTTGAPDRPSRLATEPATDCRTGPDRPHVDTATPRLSAFTDDADFDDLTTTFEWWAVDGDKVGEATVSDWSGQTVSVEVPAGALAEDGAYAWRVRSADAGAAGGWSQWCEFTVDAVPR